MSHHDVIDFTAGPQPLGVRQTVTVRARANRVADAVAITSRAFLTEELVTEKTRFLYNPEVIFLQQPVNLVKDSYYRVSIAYQYGSDTLDADISVDPTPHRV